MTIRDWLSVVALALLLAGCGNSGDTGDDDRRGTFYGGVSSGMNR